MHSSRLRTVRSVTVSFGGGGVSVRVSARGCLHGDVCKGGVCPGVSVQGLSVQGVSAQEGCLPRGCQPTGVRPVEGGVCPGGGGVFPGWVGVCPVECLPEPPWTEWQTGVKTLPCCNYIADGNNNTSTKRYLKWTTYSESDGSYKYIAISQSVHIYNAQTKGAQPKSIKGDGWTSWLSHSITNFECAPRGTFMI